MDCVVWGLSTYKHVNIFEIYQAGYALNVLDLASLTLVVQSCI